MGKRISPSPNFWPPSSSPLARNPSSTTARNWASAHPPPPPPPKGNPAPPPEPEENAIPNAALEDANPNSLLNWYRKLIELHHSNSTINSGEYLTINRDDQNVLVMIRKPKNVSPANPVLVILCNLSAQPQQLSIKANLAKLHLRGKI